MSTTIDLDGNSGVAILDRVIRAGDLPLSRDAARTLLALKFQKSDMQRMSRLAAKARKGSLTERERAIAEQYNMVGHMLALLQAKARQAIQQSETVSEIK